MIRIPFDESESYTDGPQLSSAYGSLTTSGDGKSQWEKLDAGITDKVDHPETKKRHSTLYLLNVPKESKKRHAGQRNYADIVLRISRLFMYAILFLMVLGSGVYGLLLLLTMVTKYTEAKKEYRGELAVDIAVCMAFHACVNCILAIWRIMFRPQQRPNILKGLMLILLDLVSSGGELLLLFKVFTRLDSATAIATTLFFSVIPSFLQTLQSVADLFTRGRKHTLTLLSFFRNTMAFLPLIMQVLALVYMYLEFLPTVYGDHPELLYLLPATVVAKSVGYWETFWKTKHKREQGHSNGSVIGSTGKTDSTYIETEFGNTADLPTHAADTHSTDESSNIDVDDKLFTEGEHYIEFCKTIGKVGIFLAFVLFVRYKDTVPYVMDLEEPPNATEYNEEWQPWRPATTIVDVFIRWAEDFVDEHKMAVELIALSIATSFASNVACRLHMQVVSFTLPLILVPVCSILSVFYICQEPELMHDLGLQLVCVIPTSPEKDNFKILVGVLCLSILILTWYLWVPKVERMAKIGRLFTLPLMDGIFPAMTAFLRRKHDGNVHKVHVTRQGKRQVPLVHVCVTMWHERQREMLQLLKSLFKLDKHVRMRASIEKSIKNNPIGAGIADDDKIDIDMHVVFDNAFENTNDGRVVNPYVTQFIECIDKAARSVMGDHSARRWIKKASKPQIASMQYGGRLCWTLPGGTKMTVHLKDRTLIRIKKRWSQVMYMYYTLLFGQDGMNEKQIRQKLKNTFILTLDGDVEFEPKSVWLLMDRMKKNANVGAVCGRIHPVGSGPMIWYQKFEYAIGHWLQKASEHVFGCVLCCPGCFSLFRASALVDHNILKSYTRQPEEGKHLVQFEQGEDRWLCTLLLKRGYKIDYCAGADAKTFAPEGFEEFYIQRRRWSPSTIANTIDLVLSWRDIVHNNSEINHIFMLYQLALVGTSLLAPATVVILITGSFKTVLDLDVWASFMLSALPVCLFACCCLIFKQKVQLVLAAILSTIYSFIMVVVTVGMILSIVTMPVISPNIMFLSFVATIFSLSAVLHPKEVLCVIPGILYYISVPSTFVFLAIFYMCNINDVSWGTRESKKKDDDVVKSHASLATLMKDFLKKYLRHRLDDMIPNQTKEGLNNTKSGKKKEKSIKQAEDSKGNLERQESTLSTMDWMQSEIFDNFTVTDMKHEDLFWQHIINSFLLPLENNTLLQEKFRTELNSLRNRCVYGFFMTNSMLAFSLFQLQMSRDKLLGKFYLFAMYEPVAVILLCVFASLILIQLLGMLKHRWGTFLHLVSSTELWTRNKKVDFDTILNEVTHAEVQEPETDYDMDSDISSNDGSFYSVRVYNPEGYFNRDEYRRGSESPPSSLFGSYMPARFHCNTFTSQDKYNYAFNRY